MECDDPSLSNDINSSSIGSDMNISLLHSETLAMELHDDRIISLLQNPANVNQQSVTGETPLHYVCYGNFCTPFIIEVLVSHGANVNLQSVHGDTPLHLICRATEDHCTPAIIRALLRAGANVNSLSTSRNTPLNDACRWFANVHAIKALLVGGADPNMHKIFESTLFPAVIRNECGSVLLLIEYGIDLQASICFAYRGSPLHYACFHALLDTTQILLGAGMDADLLNNSLTGSLDFLMYSTKITCDQNSQPEICALLISSGVKVTEEHVEQLKKIAEKAGNPTRLQGMLSCLMQRRSHPLSLQELCRKTIRVSLFPLRPPRSPVSAVSHLGLPTKLEKFILFGYQDMLVKYKNASQQTHSSWR